MGGSVAVCTRFGDGRFETWNRWTNTMPVWFKALDIYEKNEEYLQSYIDAGMNKTDVERVPLVPLGYGLVVIDYMTDHILTLQGYCSFESFSLYDTDPSYPKRVAEFDKLVTAKRIRADIVDYTDRSVRPKPVSSKKLTARAAPKLISEFREHEKRSWHGLPKTGPDLSISFEIDMKPFKLLEFDESATGSIQYLEKLKELEFPITLDEIDMWDEWIKHYDEEY